ncbi:MAG TPA: DUF6680 family protein, partial [Rhizomicrobium sp.]|nr:DUF6680 family protein [Rhizomicrobium sp.]
RGAAVFRLPHQCLLRIRHQSQNHNRLHRLKNFRDRLSDVPAIVTLWHSLYTILETEPFLLQRYNHAFLELMSAMAKNLGYKTLAQTDIDKFYSPKAHGNQAVLNADIQAHLLRVLKRSRSFSEDRTDPEIAPRMLSEFKRKAHLAMPSLCQPAAAILGIIT